MRSFHFIGLACFMVVAVSACKPEAADNSSDDKLAKTEAPEEKFGGLFGEIFSSDPKPARLDLGEFKILEVTLGTSLDSDNLVTNPKTQFTPKEKIYASVLSSGKHQGLKILVVYTNRASTNLNSINYHIVSICSYTSRIFF